jgi:phosphoglycolate phosphatase
VHRPAALIFDLDGTLVDSAPGICASCRAACLALGYPEPSDDDVRPLIGLPLQRLLRAVLPSQLDDAAAAAWVVRYRAEFDRIALPVTVTFPGVREQLARWRGDGRLLALATSKLTDRAGRVLAQTGLADLFDVVVGGDQVERGKPDPEMALRALALLGAGSADAAVIGDTAHDLQMACAAGVRAYAVSYGAHDRATLAAERPAAIVDRFSDLARYLG